MAYDISVPYSFKKNGIYYFERRIPRDLLKHYQTGKIAYSLRTRNAAVAHGRARRAADRLDEYWYHLRVRDSDLPGKHRLRLGSGSELQPTVQDAGGPTLSEAVGIYIRLKGQISRVSVYRAMKKDGVSGKASEAIQSQ